MIPLSRTCDSRRTKKNRRPEGRRLHVQKNPIDYQRVPLVEPEVPESPLVPIGRLVLGVEPELPPMPEPEPVVPVLLPGLMPDELPVAPEPEVPLPPVMPAPEPEVPGMPVPGEVGKLLDPAELDEFETPVVVSVAPEEPAPASDMPEVPEAPVAPVAPDMPEPPELPEVPDVPEAPEVSELPVAPEVLAPVPSEPEAPVELLSMLEPELPLIPVLPVDEPELWAKLAPATPIIEINTAKVSFFIMPPDTGNGTIPTPLHMGRNNNGLSIRLPARNKRNAQV